MRTLFVQSVLLYPRFHSVVQETLEANPPDIVELIQAQAPRVQKIQASLLEIIQACLQELKNNNKSVSSMSPIFFRLVFFRRLKSFVNKLDLSEFTVENSLFKSFDKIVTQQLGPIWNKLGPTSKGLTKSLSVLRQLLM